MTSLNDKIIQDPPTKITRALFIGINYVGTKNALQGCVSDVNKKFMRVKDFYSPTRENTRLLVDDIKQLSLETAKSSLPSPPTKENIIAGLKWLIDGAKAGDFLFVHYSGHGTQQRDTSSDEVDGKDEAICPVDCDTVGMLTDDEIRSIVDTVPEGVYLLMEMDCCHSSSVADLRECVVATTDVQSPPQHPIIAPAPPAISSLVSHPPNYYHYPHSNYYQPMPQPPKIVKIGGVPYFIYPTNPLLVKRELREYPCLVHNYAQSSRRAHAFRSTWDNIVTKFCSTNGVHAYEEIIPEHVTSDEKRAPTVTMFYSPDEKIVFTLPRDGKTLDAFLVDRNATREYHESRSLKWMQNFAAKADDLVTTYSTQMHNVLSLFRERESRSMPSRATNEKGYVIKTYQNHKPTQGVVVVWSGCKDEQTSADANINNTPVGAMTHYHLESSKSNANLRNIDVLCAERDALSRNHYDQVPQLSFGIAGDKLMTAPYPLHASRAFKTN
jgi:hypothetical protein